MTDDSKNEYRFKIDALNVMITSSQAMRRLEVKAKPWKWNLFLAIKSKWNGILERITKIQTCQSLSCRENRIASPPQWENECYSQMSVQLPVKGSKTNWLPIDRERKKWMTTSIRPWHCTFMDRRLTLTWFCNLICTSIPSVTLQDDIYKNFFHFTVLRWSLVIVLFLLAFLTNGNAYRVGDAVDTLVWDHKFHSLACLPQSPSI